MSTLHQAAPHALPAFITEPGQTDALFVFAAWFLVAAVLVVGVLFLRLHTLPERMAHKSEKLQFEIVAVLGLLALLTHMHAFWVAGLLLAMIDLPDFGSPLRRIARGVETLAGIAPDARILEEESGVPQTHASGPDGREPPPVTAGAGAFPTPLAGPSAGAMSGSLADSMAGPLAGSSAGSLAETHAQRS